METFFMHSLANTFTSIFCLKKLADCLIILKELHNFDRAMLSVAPCIAIAAAVEREICADLITKLVWLKLEAVNVGGDGRL